MNSEKEGKTISDYPRFSGFIVAIFAVVVLPLWIFLKVDERFIESASIAAVVVVPLVSALLTLALNSKDSDSYFKKFFTGMNLGNAFAVLIIYGGSKINNIVLSSNFDLTYGFVGSMVVATLIYSWERRTRTRCRCTG